MAWTWVDNLFSTDNKKTDFSWDARCPYEVCPSNQPFRGAHKSRLKYVQKVSPRVLQYRCKDCGCLTNFSIEIPDENYGHDKSRMNPALSGGKADYKFR